MDLRTQIFEALDNALGNGYDMRHVDTLSVVDDLKSMDSDLEDIPEESMFPLVQEWQKEKR